MDSPEFIVRAEMDCFYRSKCDAVFCSLYWVSRELPNSVTFFDYHGLFFNLGLNINVKQPGDPREFWNILSMDLISDLQLMFSVVTMDTSKFSLPWHVPQ